MRICIQKVVLSACLAAALLLSPTTATQSRAADLSNGRRLFQANCADCHVKGGNVVDREKTLHLEALKANGRATPAAVWRQVAEGRGKMPAFKAFLSPEQIEDVAAYVLERARSGW